MSVNERELGEALLRWEAGQPAEAPPDPRELTRLILRRDRRRVQLLAAVAVTFWVLAAGGVFTLVYVFFRYLVPKLEWMAKNPEKINRDLAHVWVGLGEGA